MKPDDLARRFLFSGNNREVSKKSGIPERTLYNRKREPGKLTLDELAGLVWAQGLDAEDIWNVLKARW